MGIVYHRVTYYNGEMHL